MAYDDSPIGQRHLHFLALEAEILGLTLAAQGSLPPLVDDANELTVELLTADPDAVVYLGFGAAAAKVSEALDAAGWEDGA